LGFNKPTFGAAPKGVREIRCPGRGRDRPVRGEDLELVFGTVNVDTKKKSQLRGVFVGIVYICAPPGAYEYHLPTSALIRERVAAVLTELIAWGENGA
jgi:hypothetical protein